MKNSLTRAGCPQSSSIPALTIVSNSAAIVITIGVIYFIEWHVVVSLLWESSLSIIGKINNCVVCALARSFHHAIVKPEGRTGIAWIEVRRVKRDRERRFAVTGHT